MCARCAQTSPGRMWVLQREGRVYYVRGRGEQGEVYVGRSPEVCDLVLSGDTSISRRHALLCPGPAELRLQDLGSRYGTFLNSGTAESRKLSREQRAPLAPGDSVRFGIVDNVWSVRRLSLATCTSTLPGEALQALRPHLAALGAPLLGEVDERCSHLTMPAVTLTLKVVQALVHACPIVTPAFWAECREAVDRNEALPGHEDYAPETIESTLNRDQVSFRPDIRRQTVFAGKKFIFFSRKQMHLYKTILLKASATVSLLSESKMTKSKLCGDEVVVIQFSVGMTGQESQVHQQMVDDIVSYMSNKARRVIPDAEIGLAILYCSTEKYCNPKFSFTSKILDRSNSDKIIPKSAVLAPETQGCSSEQTKSIPLSKVIEESFVSLNKDDESFMCKESLSVCSAVERKRKINDDNDATERPQKKQALSDFTSRCEIEDDAMFDFVPDEPNKIADVSKESVEKRLSFMKVPTRKNETVEEDDMFNFIPDQKETTVATSSGVSVRKQSLFETSATNKRRAGDLDLPKSKKLHLESPKIEPADIKASVVLLLKKSFWKSCDEEQAKHKIIKKEESLGISGDSKIELGSTIVTLRKDLIKRESCPASFVNQTDNSYTGPNYKKFKKVLPLKMQVTILSKSSMRVYKLDAPAVAIPEYIHSSDEEELLIQNTKGRKRQIAHL